jgi:4a-hydroxytetrahydrobiopterin dehydratase
MLARMANPFALGRFVAELMVEACNGGDVADLLNDDEIETHLKRSEWEREGDEIVREWRFDGFSEAIEFVDAVAEAAENASRHPDIYVHGWNKVKLSLTSHGAGGLTEDDFAMAAKLDRL